ncbi:hypothetical protein [Halobacillus sp. H74]|uniref:hypothetical protein n=1 Tax=Halobacillus sp. H74 TaxID=3457436 RepID=UPI003FCDD7A8
MDVEKVKRWSKYTDRVEGYKDLKYVLEYCLDRHLTDEERSRINWLAESGWDNVGCLVDMFREIAKKKQ